MPNQYTQVGGTSRAHDGNGNLTDDGTYLFSYDFQNRLVQLKNKSTQAVIADYRYDALGRRLRAEGASLRAIAAGLDEAGYRPRTGKRWHVAVIARLVED